MVPIARPTDDSSFQPDYLVFTDASSSVGWGGVMITVASGEVRQCGGRWATAGRSQDIHLHEANGAILALQNFARQVPAMRHSKVLLGVDNTSLKATAAKGYAAEASLNERVADLQTIFSPEATVRICYVPSGLNPSDANSRGEETSMSLTSHWLALGWKRARSLRMFAPARSALPFNRTARLPRSLLVH